MRAAGRSDEKAESRGVKQRGCGGRAQLCCEINRRARGKERNNKGAGRADAADPAGGGTCCMGKLALSGKAPMTHDYVIPYHLSFSSRVLSTASVQRGRAGGGYRRSGLRRRPGRFFHQSVCFPPFLLDTSHCLDSSLASSTSSSPHIMAIRASMGPTARLLSKRASPASQWQRHFSAGRPVSKEIQDAYILSGARTPTAKVCTF